MTTQHYLEIHSPVANPYLRHTGSKAYSMGFSRIMLLDESEKTLNWELHMDGEELDLSA